MTHDKYSNPSVFVAECKALQTMSARLRQRLHVSRQRALIAEPAGAIKILANVSEHQMLQSLTDRLQQRFPTQSNQF